MVENQQKNPEGMDIAVRVTALETKYANLHSRVKGIEDAFREFDEALEQMESDNEGIDTYEHEDNPEESNEYFDDFDPEAGRAWDALVDETKRRHTLTTETFNSTMQRIGFLLAFTPILFIEAVKIIGDATDLISYGPAILIAACFILGVIAIIIWWTPSFGVYTDDLISRYNNKDWVGVQEHILSGAVYGTYDILDRMASVRVIMNVMVLSLLCGLAMLMCEMLGARAITEIIFPAGSGIILGYVFGEIHNRLKKNKLKPSNEDKRET